MHFTLLELNAENVIVPVPADVPLSVAESAIGIPTVAAGVAVPVSNGVTAADAAGTPTKAVTTNAMSAP